MFSSKREVFVGEDAVLEWEVDSKLVKNIEEIKFGVLTRPATYGEVFHAILVKKLRKGTVSWNLQAPEHVAKFVNRTTVLKNKTAAFKIKQMSLNDSSEFYCRGKIGSSKNMITNSVNIKVIGKENVQSISARLKKHCETLIA